MACEHINPRIRAYLSPIKDDILDDILQSSHVLQFALLVRKGPVIVDGLISEQSVAGFYSLNFVVFFGGGDDHISDG